MRKGMECFINNPIYTITVESMSKGRSNIEVVGKMLEAGIKFIQYREKEKAGLDRYVECLTLREMTRKETGALNLLKIEQLIRVLSDLRGTEVQV